MATFRHTRDIMLTAAILAATSPIASAEADSNIRFEALAGRFLAQYLRTHPEAATQLGDHRFDAKTSDYSLKGVQRDKAFFHKTLDALSKIDTSALTPENVVDAGILKNELQSELFNLETIKTYQREPLNYNPASGLYLLLARDYAPLKARLTALKGRLDAIPAITAAARKNLVNPPKVFTETAIQQNLGAMSLVRDEVEAALKAEPSLREQIAPSQHKALAALQAYGEWLKKDLLPRSHGDFRLGAAAYRQKLRYSLDSDLSPEEILASAETELKAVQATMLDVALPLYRSYYPDKPTAGIEAKVIIRGVLDKLAESRPDNSTIVDRAKQDLAEATEFVRSHHIVTLPPDPVQVIVMPEFARGVAVAYCDAAGPLEKNGATFYAISPTPSDWTKARVESFFREYNDAMLKDLTVHEAMPGHYLQINVGNRAKVRTAIRQVFGSGMFAEGWATYTEQVMADAGFGGPEFRMQQLKMRLRLLINAILDQKIHAGTMTEAQAMDLMMNEGFQEEGEAAGKWRRAILTSGQLSTYFVGNLEVNRLARDLKAKTGADLQTVHDQMLSFGTIAPRYSRVLLKLQGS